MGAAAKTDATPAPPTYHSPILISAVFRDKMCGRARQQGRGVEWPRRRDATRWTTGRAQSRDEET